MRCSPKIAGEALGQKPLPKFFGSVLYLVPHRKSRESVIQHQRAALDGTEINL